MRLAGALGDQPASAGALGDQPRDCGSQLRDACTAARRRGDQLGKRRRPASHRRFHGLAAFHELRLAHLVAFCQHDLVTDGDLTERVEDGIVDSFQAVPRIDQHVDAPESGASAQESWMSLVQAVTLLLAAAA